MTSRYPEAIHRVVSVHPEGLVVGQRHLRGDGSGCKLNKVADNTDLERPVTPGEMGIASSDLDEVGRVE